MNKVLYLHYCDPYTARADIREMLGEHRIESQDARLTQTATTVVTAYRVDRHTSDMTFRGLKYDMVIVSPCLDAHIRSLYTGCNYTRYDSVGRRMRDLIHMIRTLVLK